MMLSRLSVAFVFSICLVQASRFNEEDELRKPYKGDTVLKIEPTEKLHVKILKDLVNDVKLDFWTERLLVGEPVVVRVPAARYGAVNTILNKFKIKHSVQVQDVQETVDQEWMRLQKRFSAPGGKAINLDDFNEYDTIRDWVEEMKTKCASGVTCRTYNIGKSVEGRNLTVFHMSTGSGKKAYWIDSAIHAREWLSPATVLKIFNHMIMDYSSDATVKRLVDGFDWYFMLMMNPDGYKFSWEGERYWRKNRSPNDGDECLGVDLNRNYNIKWMNDGSSQDTCSQVYAGPSAGSEPETIAIQDEANRLAPDLIAWMTVHTYANVYIFPFGHTDESGVCDRAPDHADMMSVADKVANAIENTGGNVWRRGTSCEILGASSGATDDYVKGVANVKYSATLELRGSDFVVPPSEIQPSYEEIWAGIVALVDATGPALQ